MGMRVIQKAKKVAYPDYADLTALDMEQKLLIMQHPKHSFIILPVMNNIIFTL
jgi:hypothetical protein